MLHLEGFIHRDELAAVIARWMTNEAQPGDVRFIKKAINFNSYLARIWVDHLARRILGDLTGEVHCQIIKAKGQLKDFVVDHPTYSNARIEELRARYRRFPEDFYRETPIEGCFYTTDVAGAPQFVGATRIKHFRRIAEKGARRIVDFMLIRIRENADAMAEERARRLGITKSQLVTPPAEMAEEFQHAERRVIKSLKRGMMQAGLPKLAVPDVVGAKVIVEDRDYPRLLDVLAKTGACEIVEEERHAGMYNAVNLQVAYKLPKDLLMATPPSGGYERVLAFRGFDAATLTDEYRHFVASGEDTVLVEIIVSNFEEYLESEIGRCMHEERVLSQRSHPEYQGHLATNVRHLMDYILGGLCLAPGMPEVSEVPIKLWVRYMPDTIEHIMRGVYLSREVFFDSVLDAPLTLTSGNNGSGDTAASATPGTSTGTRTGPSTDRSTAAGADNGAEHHVPTS